jgi:hypothetical protein
LKFCLEESLIEINEYKLDYSMQVESDGLEIEDLRSKGLEISQIKPNSRMKLPTLQRNFTANLDSEETKQEIDQGKRLFIIFSRCYWRRHF